MRSRLCAPAKPHRALAPPVGKPRVARSVRSPRQSLNTHERRAKIRTQLSNSTANASKSPKNFSRNTIAPGRATPAIPRRRSGRMISAPTISKRVYAQAEAAQTPVSLYMHLPFCESLCLFCACNVVITKDHSVAPPYLDTLEARNRARQPLRLPRALRRAISLGRRHAHVSDARADGRAVRLRRRAIYLRAGRGNRHRSRSARHHRCSISKRCAGWASIA